MKKIVFLPLDERPCNADFPRQLFHSPDFSIIQPNVLGDKKTPADTSRLQEFLLQQTAAADGLVIAVDTLLYGGPIPSRLHHLQRQEVEQRLATLRTIKQNNPQIKIYGFQTIMRCPHSSTSEEEPDYYGECGQEIWQLGALQHRMQLGLEEGTDLPAIKAKIKPEYLEDFLQRRRFNRSFLLQSLALVKEGIFDVFVIPQDDSAPYGFTAIDQQRIREQIAADHLQTKVLMYPGADELGCTLMARMGLALAGKTPKAYVTYSSHKAPFVTPAYEDRPLGETIRYQLLAAGFGQASSQGEADMVLAVNCPSGNMQSAFAQPCALREYTVERSLPAFVLNLAACVQQGMLVAIADVAFLNGGDLELVQMLNQQQILLDVAGYAGWNTSSNTLGTAIAQGAHRLLVGNTKQHKDFLLMRYLEDAGYCSKVRRHIYEELLEKMGYSYFDTRTTRGTLSELIQQELKEYANDDLSSIGERVEIVDCWHPWKRLFEVGIVAKLRDI